ncbi:MAG: ATPase [Bacteroidales bacterium]|nr:ATPase [Bacteroidales bacterium]
MLIIADSGSTKTDWLIFQNSNDSPIELNSVGLNPYLVDDQFVSIQVSDSFVSIDKTQAAHIFFYGAGCSTEANKKIISDGIQAVFPNAHIEVFHDMEAAARALCGTNEGISCILGTGSNACYYNGKKITKTAISLGYLVGDEGSGMHLGKRLIHAIYLGYAPNDLTEHFNAEFNLDLEMLLNNLYKQARPNRYLASFANFIHSQKEHPFIKTLIHESFAEFIKMVISPLNPNKNLPVHFTGSIAWFFQEELIQELINQGFSVGKISQKPINDLLNYHIEQSEYNNIG